MKLRTHIKRALISGYCRHLIPSWAVASTFRALRLRSL